MTTEVQCCHKRWEGYFRRHIRGLMDLQVQDEGLSDFTHCERKIRMTFLLWSSFYRAVSYAESTWGAKVEANLVWMVIISRWSFHNISFATYRSKFPHLHCDIAASIAAVTHGAPKDGSLHFSWPFPHSFIQATTPTCTHTQKWRSNA